MLHIVLLLRRITLVAAVGAGFGAIMMFGVGCAKLAHALGFHLLPGDTGGLSPTASVMEATDAFLFGLVLVVFAYAVTFVFAFDLPKHLQSQLPRWMRVDGLGDLKITLIDATLVYLVVDFATDIAEVEGQITWAMLVKPIAILFIAGARHLLGAGHAGRGAAVGAEPGNPDNVVWHRSRG